MYQPFLYFVVLVVSSVLLVSAVGPTRCQLVSEETTNTNNFVGHLSGCVALNVFVGHNQKWFVGVRDNN